MSHIYKQANSINYNAAAFGGGYGGSPTPRKTLGPGGGSDPGNSDPAGVVPNRRELTAKDASNVGMVVGGGVGTFAVKKVVKAAGWAISSFSAWKK